MRDAAVAAGMDAWLRALRARFAQRAPDLLPLVDTYVGEARFGRAYIDSDLAGVAPGARILEVGAGSLMLACQLVREGFEVTALEPTGEGFTHFDRMRRIVQELATEQGCRPVLLDIPGEALAQTDRYDYAFSVNVMEHVSDPGKVLANVAASLRAGARYRFTCPNYLFPYEPHFNIPTLVSKALTERVLGHRIRTSSRVTDPIGTWTSLNWITVPRVRRDVRRLGGVRVSFNRSLLASMLERIVSDPGFAARRSTALRGILGILVKLRLHRMAAVIPAMLQPVMDCKIQRSGSGGNA